MTILSRQNKVQKNFCYVMKSLKGYFLSYFTLAIKIQKVIVLKRGQSKTIRLISLLIDQFFNVSFFHYCTQEWNKLSKGIRNGIPSSNKFKKWLNPFIKIEANSLLHDKLSIKLLSGMRLKSHNFKDGLNSVKVLVNNTNQRCTIYLVII